MLKNILSVITGLLTGSLIIYIIEYFSHIVYPIPEGMDMKNMEAMKEHFLNMPLGAYLFVLIAWAIGTLTGGFVTSLIAGSKKLMMALITGVIFMIFGIITMAMIPHPSWFFIVGIIIYLPSAWIGGKIGVKMRN